MAIQRTTDWAREHGDPFRFTIPLDNHEPTRDYLGGEGWFYDRNFRDGDGGPVETWAILGDVTGSLRDATRAVYLLDTGDRVIPFYVAAWHPDDYHVILAPFPTNTDGDGNPILRRDTGTPVDYGTWMLGPRRAYHVKVRGVS